MVFRTHVLFANLSPQLTYFASLLRDQINSRVSRLPDVIVQGIAGCAKSTIYLELARHLNIVVIVPSNELADDLVQRAAAAGVTIVVLTQHIVFTFPGVESFDLLVIDEAFTLPSYHVYALCALNPRSVAVGDPSQLTDMAIGAEIASPLTVDAAQVFELPVSFTVPQDVIALAHAQGLIPRHWRSVSPVTNSIRILLPGDTVPPLPMITASRECAAGGRLSFARQRTIFTVQGQRYGEAILHICQRDHSAIDAGSFHQQRMGLIWTALSRHTQVLYLDLCQRFVIGSEFAGLYSADALARLG
jgi:hypothetical protein